MNDDNTINSGYNETDSSSFQPANIIVAGITGTGKSTLINAIFGFTDDKGAKTGTGKPITDHIYQYEEDDTPIKIWDTVGLELDSTKTRDSIDSIKQTIADKAQTDNHLDVIHAIWYCIDSGSSRYQEKEISFIKELYLLGIPFIIVLTQCIDEPDDINILETEIKKENSLHGMEKIQVVQVLAKDYKTRLGTIESFGLEELVRVTLRDLPEFLKNSFAAAQKVDMLQKRARSEQIIFETVAKVKKFVWERIPLIGYFPINDTTMSMLRNIATMYNLIIKPHNMHRIVTKIKFSNYLDGTFGLFYHERVENMLQEKRDQGFTANIELDYWDKPSQMVVFFGYNFVDTLEDMWNHYTEEELKKMDNNDMAAMIIERMNEKFKMYSNKQK